LRVKGVSWLEWKSDVCSGRLMEAHLVLNLLNFLRIKAIQPTIQHILEIVISLFLFAFLLNFLWLFYFFLWWHLKYFSIPGKYAFLVLDRDFLLIRLDAWVLLDKGVLGTCPGQLIVPAAFIEALSSLWRKAWLLGVHSPSYHPHRWHLFKCQSTNLALLLLRSWNKVFGSF